MHQRSRRRGGHHQLACHLLPSTYTSIRTATSASTRIVVVGYPRRFPRTQGETHDCGWLTEEERERLNTLADQLDQGMAAAAAQAGVEYVSTLNALDQHELCTSQSWMNPAVPFDSGTVHPNAGGQQAIADAVNPQLAL